MTKISVIIPVHNAEKYIAETLDSVLSQTFKDIEIICIDDGSTDNSIKILEYYKNKDERIKIIKQKNNGVVCARNNAIRAACGEFIYLLDSDDIINKTTIEKSYNAISSGKGDIITCRVQTFGEKNEEMILPFPNKINMAKRNCLVNAGLFKKSLFDKSGGFDPAFNEGLEDYDFWLNMIYRQNATFYRIPEVLFFYRIKPINESRNERQKRIYNDKLMNILNKKYPEIKKYKMLDRVSQFVFNIFRFVFQIKYKETSMSVRLFRFTMMKVKYGGGNSIYFLFGFIPIFIIKNDKIFCYYFDSVQNFGDQLNGDLFRMFGKNIQHSCMKNSDIMAIGSLLQTLFRKKDLSISKKISIKIQRPLIVYGSGFIEDTPKDFHLLRRLDVRAVRGYNTLEKLKNYQNVKIADNVAIGDPGLLSKYIIDTSNIKKKYNLGIIPHYVDKGSSLLKKIKVENSIVIDIQQSPEDFLKQLAECRAVISSAMHGLIASDSLGIPNVRMILSDKITGGDYKYNDYYSVFGINKHYVVNLTQEFFTDKDVATIVKNYKIKPAQVEKICKNLLEAYPYKEKK